MRFPHSKAECIQCIYIICMYAHLAVNCKREMAAHTRNVAYFKCILVPYDYSDRHLTIVECLFPLHQLMLSHSWSLACTAIAMKNNSATVTAGRFGHIGLRQMCTKLIKINSLLSSNVARSLYNITNSATSCLKYLPVSHT